MCELPPACHVSVSGGRGEVTGAPRDESVRMRESGGCDGCDRGSAASNVVASHSVGQWTVLPTAGGLTSSCAAHFSFEGLFEMRCVPSRRRGGSTKQRTNPEPPAPRRAARRPGGGAPAGVAGVRVLAAVTLLTTVTSTCVTVCDSRAGLPLRTPRARAGSRGCVRKRSINTRIWRRTNKKYLTARAGSRVPVSRPQRGRAAPGGRATDTTLAWTTRDGYVARERRASH